MGANITLLQIPNKLGPKPEPHIQAHFCTVMNFSAKTSNHIYRQQILFIFLHRKIRIHFKRGTLTTKIKNIMCFTERVVKLGKFSHEK